MRQCSGVGVREDVVLVWPEDARRSTEQEGSVEEDKNEVDEENTNT